MKKTKYNSSDKHFHLIIDPNKNVIITNLDSIDYNDLDDSKPDLDTIKELVTFFKNLIPNLEEKFGLKEEVTEEEDEFDEINFGEVLEVITTKPQTKQEMLNHFTPKKKVKNEKKTVKSKSKVEVVDEIESFNFEIDPNAVYALDMFVDVYIPQTKSWTEGFIIAYQELTKEFKIEYTKLTDKGSVLVREWFKREQMREKVQIKAPNGNIMRVQKIVYNNSKKVEIYTPPQPSQDFSLALDNGVKTKLSDSIKMMAGGLSAMQIGNGQTDKTNSANVPIDQRSRI